MMLMKNVTIELFPARVEASDASIAVAGSVIEGAMIDHTDQREAFRLALIEYIDKQSCVPWDRVMTEVKAIMAIYDAKHMTLLHAVIRHDDNGNNIVIQKDISEAEATTLHDKLVARAHKHWYSMMSYSSADDFETVLKSKAEETIANQNLHR